MRNIFSFHKGVLQERIEKNFFKLSRMLFEHLSYLVDFYVLGPDYVTLFGSMPGVSRFIL